VEEGQRRFVSFAVVGVVGFVVDASVVWMAIHWLKIGPYVARIGSYLAAATVTWWLNRTFTFRSTSPAQSEFVKFLIGNSLGAALNFAIYSAIIAFFGAANWLPVAAVAAGSLAGLCVNFVVSSNFVFQRDIPIDQQDKTFP
jgi:putative flippase GtrA